MAYGVAMMPLSGKLEDSTLPQNHEDQLQLGIRIITSAFTGRMRSLEQEIAGLKFTNEEQRHKVTLMSKKSSSLEMELVECQQRSHQLQEENKELFKTVETLRKQISRLDNLKAAVLSSIQEESMQDDSIDGSRVLMNEEYLRNATPVTASQYGRDQQSTIMAQPTQRLAQVRSFGGQMSQDNQRGDSGAAVGSPGNQTDPTSPIIDGKAFFRHARGQLSYESFNSFLASIKRLNNQQQTREETLEEASRIFGPNHTELYKDFEALLTRHAMV